jgi:hypothetical protein
MAGSGLFASRPPASSLMVSEWSSPQKTFTVLKSNALRC